MNSPESAPRAYIDESFRMLDDVTGVYLLAAVKVPATDEDDIRRELRRMLPGHAPRLHWREDRPATRRRGLRILIQDGISIRAVAVVTHGVERRRQERTRSDALWHLIFALHGDGIQDVMLEARERRQNDKDVVTLQRIFAVPEVTGMRYLFGRPIDEPLLWLADYLVGAIGDQLRGITDEYVDMLPAGFLTRIDITAR